MSCSQVLVVGHQYPVSVLAHKVQAEGGDGVGVGVGVRVREGVDMGVGVVMRVAGDGVEVWVRKRVGVGEGEGVGVGVRVPEDDGVRLMQSPGEPMAGEEQWVSWWSTS